MIASCFTRACFSFTLGTDPLFLFSEVLICSNYPSIALIILKPQNRANLYKHLTQLAIKTNNCQPSFVTMHTHCPFGHVFIYRFIHFAQLLPLK